jgi:hypothetical protein
MAQPGLAGSLSMVLLPQTNRHKRQKPLRTALYIRRCIKLAKLLLILQTAEYTHTHTHTHTHTPGDLLLKLKSDMITFILRSSEKFIIPFQVSQDILKTFKKL